MNITKEMIHPELRRAGTWIRRFVPYTKPSTFKLGNILMNIRVIKPKSDVRFEQVHIKRADGTTLRICVYSPLEK